MTKKTFELVAAIMRVAEIIATTPEARNVLTTIVDLFCSEFRKANGRFDEARFRKACGL